MRLFASRLLPATVMLAVGLIMADPALAGEHERIVDYHSHLLINADSTIAVTETIVVEVTGERITHGVWRDFPAIATNRMGFEVPLRLDVVEARLDGEPEPWSVSRREGGLRIDIGDQTATVAPGLHVYTLRYTLEDQIGFFTNFDELLWNVTGNGWELPVDRAGATVDLPTSEPFVSLYGFVRPKRPAVPVVPGELSADGPASFYTRRGLAPGQAMVIVASWSKGIVAPPTEIDRLGYLLADKRGFAAGLVGIAALLVFYLVAWVRVARAPTKELIAPSASPPGSFSAAAVRFVRITGFDEKAFAATLVAMAVKGCLVIRETAEGAWRLERTGAGTGALSPGEKRIARKLFGREDADLELGPGGHGRIGKAIGALHETVREDFEKVHFSRNAGYLIGGALITLVPIAGVILDASEPAGVGLMAVWLIIWSFACWALLARVVGSWQFRREGEAALVLLASLPLLVGWVMGVTYLASAASFPAAALLIAAVLINALFYSLLKAPTVRGQAVRDEIEALRLFLARGASQGERTPAEFERYLPYALALDVEQEWSAQFAAPGYTPGWHGGPSRQQSGTGGLVGCLSGGFLDAVRVSSPLYEA